MAAIGELLAPSISVCRGISHVSLAHPNRVGADEYAAASIAATAAGLTYLDGKYHLRQDWQAIRAKNRGARLLLKASESNRGVFFFFFIFLCLIVGSSHHCNQSKKSASRPTTSLRSMRRHNRIRSASGRGKDATHTPKPTTA